MPETFLNTVRRLWLLFSVLLLLLGVSIWMQYKQANKIVTLESAIQRQTALLNQVFGNVLPAKISTEWEDRLNNLEAQVADSSQWPEDATEAKRFLDQVSELVTGLPVWAEANYLPKLSLVRWAAAAFTSLYRSQNPNESFADLVEERHSLANAKPGGEASNLDQKLRDAADKAKEQMIEQAWQYLKGDANTQQDPTTAKLDIESIYEFLGLYENDGSDISILRQQLHGHIVIRQAEQQANMLKTQWEAVKALAESQPRVYEAAANMLLRDVMAARVDLVLKGVQQSAYNELESALRHAIEEQQDKAMREYQGWALRKIKEFEERFRSISDQAAQNASVLKLYNGGWNNDRYKEVREAIVSHLLPINSALLDLPVLNRYQRAYQDGWKKLDGREEQIHVAERSALTPKKSLRAVLEDQ